MKVLLLSEAGLSLTFIEKMGIRNFEFGDIIIYLFYIFLASFFILEFFETKSKSVDGSEAGIPIIFHCTSVSYPSTVVTVSQFTPRDMWDFS